MEKELEKDLLNEIKKCTDSPYYFATKYLTITDTQGYTHPFTTMLSEEEFNELIKSYGK